MWHSRPPRDPPPSFMANAILNFHFDFLNPSLMSMEKGSTPYPYPVDLSCFAGKKKFIGNTKIS